MKKIYIFLILILLITFKLKIKAYNYGDEVTYKGIGFYVLEDKGDTVTLFSKEPLSTVDINYFGYGHVNWYNEYSYGYPTKTYTKKAVNVGGYGKVAFYSRKKCNNIDNIYTKCTNDYNKSDIKYIVDAWAKKIFDENSLVTDETGYSVRLMNKQEIDKYYIYEYREASPSDQV